MNESPRGFISAPTLDQLKPTEHEKALLKVLWDWQEAGLRARWFWDSH